MTLTVRLDPDVERRFEAECRRRKTTKSAIVTRLIQEFIAREPQASSYEVAARLGVVGADTGGPTDRAANAKRYLRKALRAKHRR